MKLNDDTLHIRAFWSGNYSPQFNDSDNFREEPIPKLRSLILSGNELSNLDVNMLGDLLHLTYVDLSKNLLHTIAAELFDGNPILEEIHLQRNRIADLRCDFGRLQQLNFVDMRFNHMNKFPETIFKHFLLYGKSTAVLNLSRNRLPCDCNLSWLFDIQDVMSIKLILGNNQLCTELYRLENVKIQCFARYKMSCNEPQIKMYLDNCRS